MKLTEKVLVVVATVFLHLPGIVPLARKYSNPITLQTKCRLQLGNLESCKHGRRIMQCRLRIQTKIEKSAIRNRIHFIKSLDWIGLDSRN